MQQYYEKGDIQLYLDDCIEILEKTAPESVDMIFADPPKEGKKEIQILTTMRIIMTTLMISTIQKIKKLMKQKENQLQK